MLKTELTKKQNIALMIMISICMLSTIATNMWNRQLYAKYYALSEEYAKLQSEYNTAIEEILTLREQAENKHAEEHFSVTQKAYDSAPRVMTYQLITDAKSDEQVILLNNLTTIDETLTYTIIDPDLSTTLSNHQKMFDDTVYDHLSETELMSIWSMVETETYQCPFISKVYVAEVAFARYVKYGSSNMSSIINAQGQFSHWRTNISEDTILAVEYAYQYRTEAQNALYFQRGKCEELYGCPWLFEDISGHNFYGYDMYDDISILPEV